MKSFIKLSFHRMSLGNVDSRNVIRENKVDYIYDFQINVF